MPLSDHKVLLNHTLRGKNSPFIGNCTIALVFARAFSCVELLFSQITFGLYARTYVRTLVVVIIVFIFYLLALTYLRSLSFLFQYELLFCIQDIDDNRLRMYVESLKAKFPAVDCQVR